MAEASPPLDYSFRDLRSVQELSAQGPRRSVKRYRRSQAGLYACRALRLNNNLLTSIRGLHAAVFQVLDQPDLLTWIDLSFNKLTALSSEISGFSSLKILYLHGNSLRNLDNVLQPLRSLSKLYSLTLHGNPLEEQKNYRHQVLAILTHLRSLDFINVTSADARINRKFEEHKSRTVVHYSSSRR
ncbi:leucine-rich repeat-containing protein 51 [Anabrus simplex]|uniref:leucine-rich repeat-containing protein 51 n=1 Tax=Anabrus simplex TaxID=316456 RepID=UPI0035A35E59